MRSIRDLGLQAVYFLPQQSNGKKCSGCVGGMQTGYVSVQRCSRACPSPLKSQRRRAWQADSPQEVHVGVPGAAFPDAAGSSVEIRQIHLSLFCRA